MALSTQPYKGTRDFFPKEMRRFRWMFQQMRHVVEGYGFEEYDGPMLEPFELYAAKTGEEIVNQQLYWMMDRGERKLAVRPEMTPTLARMVAQRVMELPKPVRWYSIPNLWRYERPQRGRLREHWQLNADILGGDTLLADVEILCVAVDLIRKFGPDGQIVVKLNHRGLTDHFFTKVLGLNADLAVQVIKVLDARTKMGEDAFGQALQKLGLGPEQEKAILAFFAMDLTAMAEKHDCEAVRHLVKVLELLKKRGFDKTMRFDPGIMRGMDYYTGLVFEIYDTSPENQRAMFGGGRYDNLIGLFGNQKLSGIGFGMGDVTVHHYLETHGLLPALPSGIDVFVTLPSEALFLDAERIAADLRAQGLRVATPLEVGGFGQQLKMAAKHEARFAVLLGEAERARNAVMLKDLTSGNQIEVLTSDLAKKIKESLSS